MRPQDCRKQMAHSAEYPWTGSGQSQGTSKERCGLQAHGTVTTLDLRTGQMENNLHRVLGLDMWPPVSSRAGWTLSLSDN